MVAEQRAQDVIVTVNAVQNATNDLGRWPSGDECNAKSLGIADSCLHCVSNKV